MKKVIIRNGPDALVMNGTQLRLLRYLFMITAETAAKLIGFVELQTWLRWEKGISPVPYYVVKRVISLNHARQSAITEILEDEELQNYSYNSQELESLVDYFFKVKKKFRLNKTQPALNFDSVAAGVYAYLLDEMIGDIDD